MSENDLIYKSLSNSGLPLNKLNSAIASVNQSVLCGPACQSQQRDETLHRAYLDAKSNVENAPNELQLAEKEYYVNVKGEQYYDDLLEKRYNSEAQNGKVTRTNKYKALIKQLKILNQDYDIGVINLKQLILLRNKLIKENVFLKNKIEKNISSILTNDRQTYYEVQQIDTVSMWTNLFHVFYWLVFICFAIIHLVVKKKYMNIYIWLKLIGLVLLPFFGISLFINFITFLINVGNLIWVTATGQH